MTRKSSLSFCLAALALLSFCWESDVSLAKQTPIQDRSVPILQLNPEGHMGEISSISFTGDGKFLLSAGLDKQVRVWNLKTGKTQKIIRGEIGAGSHGHINTMSRSPNGKLIAVAGWMSSEKDVKAKGGLSRIAAIRIFDYTTGKLVSVLKGQKATLLDLAFSPDGKAIASVASNILIVWDVKTGKILHRIKDHNDWVKLVSFSPDGQYIITGSDDDTLIVREADSGKKIAQMKGHTKDIVSMKVSPDSKLVYSVSNDKTLRVWEMKTGKMLRILARLLVKPGDITVSPDGKILVSSNYDEDRNNYDVTTWDSATGKKHLVYKKHLNKVPALAISPDGKWVASVDTNAHEIHVWDLKTGKVRHILKSLGSTVWSVGFSADGRSIAFGKKKVRDSQTVSGPLQFRMKLPTSDRPLGVPQVLTNAKAYPIRARDRKGSYRLRRSKTKDYDMYGRLEVYRKRKRISRIIRGDKDGYAHETYSFTPDGKHIISGAEGGELSIYSLKGKKLGDFVGHTDTVYSVAVSPNGKLLLSGSADQTLRLWNIKTRKLIVSMFHSRGGEWIIWTKQGYYSSSPNGDRFIGWQVNRGAAKTPRYIAGEQLKQKFYRPDIVEKAIFLASGKRAVKEARNTRFALKDLAHRQPPEFNILSPYQNQAFTHGEVIVSLKLKSNPDPIKHFEISVNGVQIITRSVKSFGSVKNKKGKGLVRHFKVSLLPGGNTVKIRAVSAVGNMLKILRLTYNARARTVYTKSRGTLYLVAIGVDKYPHIPKICNTSGGSCDLNFAGKDAYEFYNMMVKSVGSLHQNIKATLLVNKNVAPESVGALLPVKSNIEDALDDLREATANDTVLLFLAGHGVNDKDTGSYYFLPTNAKRRKNRWQSSSVVHWKMLQSALQESQGRRLMFVDTCHSGNAYNPRLVKDAADSNIVVFSATDADTLAQEMTHLKNGVFTHSILKAFEDSHILKDKKIKILELTSYVSENVEMLTKNLQQPQISLAGVRNFVLGKKVR